MPTVKATSWVQRNHGQPTEIDSRWSTDRVAMYDHIHIRRKRAWVKWRKSQVPSLYSAPVVGLVVKPLDTYENIVAFIPWEKPNEQIKPAPPSLSADRGPGQHSDSGPQLPADGEFRDTCGQVSCDVADAG